MPEQNLPPGQQLVASEKWPFVGERKPLDSDAPWSLEIKGLVDEPITYYLDSLLQLPAIEMTVDIHCVTRWSRLGVNFRGVMLEALIDQAKPQPASQYVSFVARSKRKHSTSLLLDEAIQLKTMIAYEVDGEPMPLEHGGPIRSIVPGKYFYKSVKWLEKIELLADDRLGYWEAEAGYHNNADPWNEERYMAATLNKREAKALIDSRDFRGHDLRSIEARDRDLERLQAEGAVLRNADFRKSDLQHANFTFANLSNARLNGCNLNHAKFVRADLEGADLSGADLRRADLSGASLFGASFCSGKNDNGQFQNPAKIDLTTIMPQQAEEFLTPIQWEFLQARSPTWVI